MRSGVGPFRQLRMSRKFLFQYRGDPHELYRFWPEMADHEEAEFKRV